MTPPRDDFDSPSAELGRAKCNRRGSVGAHPSSGRGLRDMLNRPSAMAKELAWEIEEPACLTA